jgi:hypothetical protein
MNNPGSESQKGENRPGQVKIIKFDVIFAWRMMRKTVRQRKK